MERILIDTSALVALLNKRDNNHRRAIELMLAAKERKARLFLTNFVLGETYAALLSRVGPAAARRWLAENDLPVVRVNAGDEERAKEILLRFTDKDFSYVDATSFAVMTRLNVNTAFAFDAHFEQYGLTLFAARNLR